MKSPYEVLGVGKSASAQEIASAYRKKAILHHPDRNPGDSSAEAKFREATEAYSVLSDPEKRLSYDTREAEQEEGPTGPFDGGPGSFNDMWGIGFDGRRKYNRIKRSGKDVEKEIEVTVEESVLGTSKTVITTSGEKVACTRCSGQRTEPGTKKMPCTHCAGSGRAFFMAPDGLPQRQGCRSCDGNGDVPMRKCKMCDGAGTVRSRRDFLLKIPAGISDGQRLRLAGQGEPGDDGPPGDMYVTVKVKEGGRFSRIGNDLHTVVRIPLHVALGQTVGPDPTLKVFGIDSKEYEVRLPAGLKPGETQYVVQGAGVGGISGARGNMYIVFHVDLPEVRTQRAAALIRELVDELSARTVER